MGHLCCCLACGCALTCYPATCHDKHRSAINLKPEQCTKHKTELEALSLWGRVLWGTLLNILLVNSELTKASQWNARSLQEQRKRSTVVLIQTFQSYYILGDWESTPAVVSFECTYCLQIESAMGQVCDLEQSHTVHYFKKLVLGGTGKKCKI